MKIKLISIVLFLTIISTLSLFNGGCASNSAAPTTQAVLNTGNEIYSLIAGGYSAAIVFADIEYSKKNISVNAWNQDVVPAFQSANAAAVSFINNYDSTATAGGGINAFLQSGANSAVLAIYPAVEQAIIATVAGNGPGGIPPQPISPLPAPPE
jgi:hypothetical protein